MNFSYGMAWNDHFLFLDKGKEPKAEAECSEWQYEKCVPNSGDCGAGIREATCNEQTKKTKCKVPCNWKRDFGGKICSVWDLKCLNA